MKRKNSICQFCNVSEADNHFQSVQENKNISSCLECSSVALQYLSDQCQKEKDEAEVVELEKKLRNLKKKK